MPISLLTLLHFTQPHMVLKGSKKPGTRAQGRAGTTALGQPGGFFLPHGFHWAATKTKFHGAW